MDNIYLALVDTPGLFASIIRKTIGISYIHVVISLDSSLKEAYSVGRRVPSVPLIAGFEQEKLPLIQETFPTARYKIMSLPCTKAQKELIAKRLSECYEKRFRYHYCVIGLPFLLLDIPFYQKRHFTCSSFIAKLLTESGLPLFDKHFSLVTPRDFYELPQTQTIYEGHLQHSIPWVIIVHTLQHKGKPHMNRKNILSICLFIALMLLTFYTVLHGNDMNFVWQTVRELNPFYLAAAFLTGLFFVSAEGLMICYLLRALNCQTSPLACIRISFIGFFYSGITPSATGGQPMQLYYMKKSGLRIADSTVVLMTVALIYKLVLVLIGIGILIFWYPSLCFHLKNYIYLYYLGLFLNTALVAVLLFIMISPRCFHTIVISGEKLLIRLHILKHSDTRTQKLFDMADSYHEAVLFFLQHKKHIAVVTAFTFLQRFCVFFVTWLIYKGMGLSGYSMMTVTMIQATVYIAVDMLPLPGSQGITELMYKTVYSAVFPGAYLTASMCVTRTVNFYFLLIVSALIAAAAYMNRFTFDSSASPK